MHVLARASTTSTTSSRSSASPPPRRGALMRVAIAGAGKVGPLDRRRAHRATATRSCSSTATRRRIRPDSIPGAQWLVGRRVRGRRSSRRPTSPAARSSSPPPATTRSTSSSRCWPRPSSASPASSPASTTPRTSGCSTRPGASTSRCRPRACCPRSSRRPCRVGDLVRLFTFRQGDANLVELTLPPTSPLRGQPGRRRDLAERHRPRRDPARRPGHRRRPPTTRSRPATSCSSSPPPEAEPLLQEMLSPHGGWPPSALRPRLALGHRLGHRRSGGRPVRGPRPRPPATGASSAGSATPGAGGRNIGRPSGMLANAQGDHRARPGTAGSARRRG